MLATLDQLAVAAARCTSCALHEARTQVVFGAGDPEATLMIVGEAPGAQEDLDGVPFIGRCGKLLDRLLDEELGTSRDRCYITNVVKCRPPANRDPRRDEIAACHHHLEAQVALLDPKVTVTLGRFAAQELLGTRAALGELRGRAHPFGSGTLVPALHPAAALRGGAAVLEQLRGDLALARHELGW